MFATNWQRLRKKIEEKDLFFHTNKMSVIHLLA